MAGWGRKVGVVGFLLSVGVACTQLFGERQNTLAPIPGKAPTISTPALAQIIGDEPLAVCEIGQQRCDGASLQTCSDDRSSWVTLQRCAAAALCQSNPATCLMATCSEDEMTCAGAALQKCNADRTGWDLFATCLSPAHCNADQRQCLTEPCAAGQRRCDRSELDQSPVLEVCRDDGLDWSPLDACVTRELCDQTLTGGSLGGGLIIGSDGLPQVQAPVTPEVILKCNLPACNVGEVHCNGARLEFCSEGRTGWISAEECASAALCSGSLNNVGSSGAPVCLPAVCGVGQHRCGESGMLQVCSEDRTGFRDLEQCISAPFCNAVLADQGQAGCRDAPCDAGLMQCNGAQIQVCREDRTALDDVGAACESTALCNADDPANAFCEEPACRRGATSGSEFRCEGAQLRRCNELLTGYDTIQTCATAALCDASQRFNGCRPPVCRPGQHDCSGGFLRTCNADQTAFENTENCGSQAQCDANAGRCADPCEPGATRCNQGNGDLERCTDPLTGWRPIADCPNVQLCDQPNGRCDICLGDQFSCADNQLRQCAPDGGTFRRQNIGPECATLPNNGGVGVRLCQNNSVQIRPCPNGCTNGTCHECTGNQTRCSGNQIQRCMNGFFAAATSCSDNDACNGIESCNANTNGCDPPGRSITCNDGNNCTNDSCNSASGCRFTPVPNRTICDSASGTLQSCTDGTPRNVPCGELGCAPNSTICNNCRTGQCNGNQFTPCNNGRLGTPVPCNDTDGNSCTGVTCDPQRGGCVSQPLSGNSCADTDRCDGAEVCNNGVCPASGTTVRCDPPADPCKTSTCSQQTGGCVTDNGNDGRACNNGAGTCRAGICQPNCSPNTATCANGSTRRVCAPDGSRTTDQPCGNATPFCVGTGNCVACRSNADCGDPNPCTTDTCDAQGVCRSTLQANCCNFGIGVVRCQANGTLATCNNGVLTTATVCPNGCVLSSSACTPPPAPTPQCALNQETCVNGVPMRCRADRTGFEPLSRCEQITVVFCEGTTVRRQTCDDGNDCTFQNCRLPGGGGDPGGCIGGGLPRSSPCRRAGGVPGFCGDLDAVCHECAEDANCPPDRQFCNEFVCSNTRPIR